MTARYFCDGCGAEIAARQARLKHGLQIGGNRIMVEVITGVNQVWNGGHVCNDCVIKVVNQGLPIGSDGWAT